MIKLDRFGRISPLLTAGLFLLWNWRLATIATSSDLHVERVDLIVLFAIKSTAFLAVFIFVCLLLRGERRASLALSLFVFGWILIGGVFSLIADGAFFYALIYGLFTGFIFFATLKLHAARSTLFPQLIFVFAATVIGLQVPNIYAIVTINPQEISAPDLEIGAAVMPAEDLPHIIYIVPDRYASNAVLRELYGFSNQAFTADLEARGFHVWDNQMANYPRTFLSLASTLNADYLDETLKDVPKRARSYQYVYPLLQNFAAWRALKSIGYEYAHIGGWWDPTRHNDFADANFFGSNVGRNRLTETYLATTPLQLARFFRRKRGRLSACDVVDRKLDWIEQRVHLEAPQFVFWHSFITHEPYIFGADGTCRSIDKKWNFVDDYAERRVEYLAHIEKFNALTLALIDRVFETSTRDVIFVIQSDEGPFPAAYIEQVFKPGAAKYDFQSAIPSERRRKHGIFNAIYLPSQTYDEARTQVTPVNNFRLILSELTDPGLNRLPDRTFSFKHDYNPYVRHESTEVLLED